jgi:hypothetical protein
VHVANEGAFDAAVDALVAVIHATEEGSTR